MGSAVKLRTDYSAVALRQLAKEAKDARQARRLLSLAAILDGMSREDAARVGGMDRQTLRDWVHRFNAAGPEGLSGQWSSGPSSRLSPEQRAELAAIVEAGPDPRADGVVRWRHVDLKRVIEARFGVDYDTRYVGKVLHKLGFSHISARPQHPAQDAHVVEAFKKLRAHTERPSGRPADEHAGRDLVPRRSQNWSEEWCRAAMGAPRHAAPPAGRPALKVGLSPSGLTP